MNRIFTPRARQCLVAQFNRLAQEYRARVLSDHPYLAAGADHEVSPLWELRTKYGVAQVSADVGKRLAHCRIQFASPADAYADLRGEVGFNRFNGIWATHEAPCSTPDLRGSLFISEIRHKLSRITASPVTADRFIAGESVGFVGGGGRAFVAAYRANVPGQDPHICIADEATGQLQRRAADEAEARRWFAQLQSTDAARVVAPSVAA